MNKTGWNWLVLLALAVFVIGCVALFFLLGPLRGWTHQL
jgi:hypothetical protein